MALIAAAAPAMASSPCCSFGMGNLAGPAICCSRDGGAGARLSDHSVLPLWKQPRGRGSRGLGGLPFGGGTKNRFLGQPVEQWVAIRRGQGWQVNVAADHSGSRPDAHKRRGKWGYHPLEELTKHEREAMLAGTGRPSDAEIARTISEVNWNAIICASVVSDEDTVFGTEVQFLVDEHGVKARRVQKKNGRSYSVAELAEFFFEVTDDNEFLSNLSASQTFTVLIGFGSMDEIHVSEMVEEVGEDEDEDDEESDLLEEDSDDSEDEDNLEDLDVRFWEEMVPGAAEVIQEALSPESLGSLGGWGGPDTLTWVHPLEFANKIAQAVSADHTEVIDKPTKRLTLTGVVRKVTEQEEPYVQSLWYDRFLWNENDDDEVEEEAVQGEGREEEGGDEEGKKRSESDKNVRTRATVGNGAPSTSNSSAQGQGTGKTKLGLKNGKRNANKDEQRVNGQKLKPEDVWQLTTSDSENPDISLPASEVVDGQDATRGINGARNRGTSTSGVYVTDDKVLEVGSRIEDLTTKDQEGSKELDSISDEEGGAVEGEWTEESTSGEVGTTFYKLELISLQLDTSSGLQSSIEVQDFYEGEPDILAHSAEAIMERVNSGGSRSDRALKALCRREKGLEVDKVTVTGVDCMGMEVRVSSGIEVQTLRFQFSRKVTSEKVADQLIDQLLNPRPGNKRPRKSQQPRSPRR